MDDLENIFSNLKLNSGNLSDTKDVDKYLKEIDIALKNNETTSRWIDELEKEYGSVIDEELNKLRETPKNGDDYSNTSEDDAGALRYSVVETIAKRCLQIEIKIRRDEFQAADATALVKYINQHRAYYVEKEYMVGFRYVANCLAIKGHIKEIRNKNESKQVNAFGLKDLLKTLNEYQNFGIQHRIGVLAVKQYFAGNLMKGVTHDFQLRIIRDLVKMDPENLEWLFCLYSVLRFKRADSKTFSSPSQDEIDVIVKAIDKRYAIFDARICLGYAFCLAEVLKNSGKIFTPIKFGRKVFYCEAEALGCIRAKVDDVLAIDPTSVRSNIDVAKIYSSILPNTHRDTVFAMVCIKRALMFHPNSSKANHRMAALLISTNSPSAALEYLQKAVENDEGNVFATIDLLKVSMANISAHKTKMDQVFSNPTYKIRKHYGEILLLNAVYSHLNGNSQKSVDLVIEAVNNNAKCFDTLERIHITFKRFNWTDYNSFSKNIKKILELRMTTCPRSEKEILTKIWKSLKDEYENSREKFNFGRGKYKYDDLLKFFNSLLKGSYQSRGSQYHSGYRSGTGSESRYGSRGKSYNSYQSGGSSYDSGYKGGNGSGSGSGHENKKGLSKTATQSDIKKQFYKLAKEHHPDKNMHLPPEELLKKQELMKRINSAFHTLQDQCKP